METKYEFTLDNGKTFNSDSKNVLLLIPELMDENNEKIKSYFNIANSKYVFDVKFVNGVASVCRPDTSKWGAIDKEGNVVIPFIYKSFGELSEKLEKRKAKFKTITVRELITEGQYWETISDFKDPVYEFYTNIIDEDGNVVLSDKGKDYKIKGEPAENGLILVQKDMLCGYIDMEGKMVIPYEYPYAYGFNDDLAGVFVEGRWGFIDKDNNEVVPSIYDKVKSFSDGLALVKLNGESFFIDTFGDRVDIFLNEEVEVYQKVIEKLVSVFSDSTTFAYDLDTKAIYMVSKWTKQQTYSGKQFTK